MEPLRSRYPLQPLVKQRSRSVALPAPSSGIMSQSIARLPLKHGLAVKARPRRKFRLLDVVSNLSRLSFLAERPHSEQCRKPESLVCHFVSFGQMHNVRLLQKRQSIVQSNSSVATQRMRIACQPALAVPFDSWEGLLSIRTAGRLSLAGSLFARSRGSEI